ncbi:MAG: hypothetical protein RL095_540 [Verrucomicrobiota bacterium]|jgi:quinol monooxygenase YgiN
MSQIDTCVSIVPYFRIHSGKIGEFKLICEKFVARTASEKDCLYYGFCFDGDLAFCREAYADGQSALAHIEHVGDIIQEALRISELERFEIHGPESELTRMRAPLAALNPLWLSWELGFRR